MSAAISPSSGVEALVRDILERPEITAAVQNATFRFTVLLGDDIPPGARNILGEAMREWATRQVRLALHSEPGYPKVLHDLLRPGSRGPASADDPDETWSVVPVDRTSRLRVRLGASGTPTGHCTLLATTNLTQTLNGNPATVVARLDCGDLTIADDGTALVTLGPDAADGRNNHLTTTIDTRYLLVREHTADWTTGRTPIAVEPLEPPAREALDIDQVTALAARFIIDDVGNAYPIRRLERTRVLSGEQTKSAMGRYGTAPAPDDYWLPQMFGALGDNTVSAPADGAVGPAQQVVRGRLALADDQAFVLRVDPGGAADWSVIAYGPWLMTRDASTRPVSRNRMQSAVDPDGSATYVVSARDTGAANWIDIAGLGEPLLVIAFETPARPPRVHGEVVALTDQEPGPVHADARHAELTRRAQLHQSRFEAGGSITHG